MGVELITPGAKWVDASFSRPPAAAMLAAGYTGFVGYVSRPPADPKKNVTKRECDLYLAAGINVGIVWEMSATTANKGAEVGRQHGEWAAIDARRLGLPLECALIAADDTNTIAANIDAQEAYLRGFDSTCEYPLGVYGDTDIVARINDIVKLKWVTVSAWSWSSAISQADAIKKALALKSHVLQYGGFALDGKWNVDPNTVVNPFLAWSTKPTPPVISPPVTTPPQKERTMITNKQPLGAIDIAALKAIGLLEPNDAPDPGQTAIKAHGGFWHIHDDSRLRHITSGAELVGRGGEASAVEMDTALILQFTKWTPQGSSAAPSRFRGVLASVPGEVTLIGE